MIPEALCKLRVAVVGASLGELSAANVLHKLGVHVACFEAFPQEFHQRGGALGSVDVRLLKSIRHAAFDVPSHSHSHGFFYGDVWEHLYSGLPNGTVSFGADVKQVLTSESSKPKLLVEFTNGDDESCEERELSFDFVLGCDSGKSTMRSYVTDMKPTYEGYAAFRGLVNRAGIAGPPSGSIIVGGHMYSTLGFPCPGPIQPDGSRQDLWNCGVYMPYPESEVEAPSRNRQVSAKKEVPDWFLPLVRQLFSERDAKFWSDCAAHGKISPHPVWELAVDRAVHNRVVLLGDAAHMSSPRTGAGAYTAMVDAVMLREALEMGENLDQALDLYNDDVVKRGQELVR